MKKIFSFVLLMIVVATLPTMFTSCENDEPEGNKNSNNNSQTENNSQSGSETTEDQFDDLYGYWINSDRSGAMEFVKNNSYTCKVTYYTVTSNGLKNTSCDLNSISARFSCYNQDGHSLTVSILSNSKNRIVLQNLTSYYELSSYSFSRVTETVFYDYLEGKNNGNNDEPVDDKTKLVGSWKYEDYGDEYILTFYNSGRAEEEVWIDGDYLYTETGTYEYSNGRITEWNIEGSSFYQGFDELPWIVTFNSSTSMTLSGTGKYANKITLKKI